MQPEKKINRKWKLLMIILLFLFVILAEILLLRQFVFNENVNIDRFVSKSNFPEIQSIETVYKGNDTEVFEVTYGEPMDCPSGCFYSQAVGLKHSSKIGWISGVGFNDMYDIDENDSEFIFSNDFFDDLQKIGNGSILRNYANLLARDADTPVETLKAVYNRFNPLRFCATKSLYDNPDIKKDTDFYKVIKRDYNARLADEYSLDRYILESGECDL